MKNYFLLLLFFMATLLHSQAVSDSACRDFHTGNFYVKGMSNLIVERDSATQTEKNLLDNTYVKMSVTWTSACTYELRYIDSNKKRERKKWKKIIVLEVTINETQEDSYHFSETSVAFAEPVTGTLVRKP
ncbi:MAG: hypothetical protein HY064_16245 [Bacteroidetes bacterium]|nr:hypothetical protein [Bacteroidota bacterium]